MAHLAQLSDVALVEAARGGSREAYAVLWSRHVNAGLGFARSYSRNGSPEDLVSEAFTRIFSTIRKGGGPTGAFRAYLIASIRNIAIAWSRSGRHESNFEDFDLLEGADSAEAQALSALENSITSKAFSSLPARWQEVLWYSEIERLARADIAVLLGMKPNAVSQLMFRAREGLRAAWIQAHLNAETLEPEHKEIVELLGARARGTLSRRDARTVNDHVETCASCLIMAEEADRVGARLAFVILPIVAGVAGAASYLSTLHGSTATDLALGGAASDGVASTDLPLGADTLLESTPRILESVPRAAAASAPSAAVVSSTWVVGVAASVLVAAGAVWGVGNLDHSGPRPEGSAAAHVPSSRILEPPAERTDRPRVSPIIPAPVPVLPEADEPVDADEDLETATPVAPETQGPAPTVVFVLPAPSPLPSPGPVTETNYLAITSPARGVVLASSTFEVELAVVGAAEVNVEVDGSAHTTVPVVGGTARAIVGPLSDGVHCVRVATDVPGTPDHRAAAVEVVLDTVAGVPQAVIVQDPASPFLATIIGDAEPGATITADVEGRLFTTTAGADGSWSMGATVDAAGTFLVSISQRDLAGNLSAAAVLEFTVHLPQNNSLELTGLARIAQGSPMQRAWMQGLA